MVIFPGQATIAMSPFLSPLGRNCRLRGRFRFLWSTGRPDLVFNSCQYRVLPFFFETTVCTAFKK